MIPQIGILTVIGLALTLAIYIAKWWFDSHAEQRKKQDDIDKEIDNANSFDDFVRINDKLRDK